MTASRSGPPPRVMSGSHAGPVSPCVIRRRPGKAATAVVSSAPQCGSATHLEERLGIADRRRLHRLGTSAQPPGPSTASSKKRRAALDGLPAAIWAPTPAKSPRALHGMQLDRGRLVRDDAPHQLRPAAGQPERQQRPV